MPIRGPEGIALPWIVIMGFVRLSTNIRAFAHPFRPEEAIERVEEWLSLPHVQITHPSQRHFPIWTGLLHETGAAGNLTTDAHLAALAIERGLTLYSTDADFSRFPGLKWINPLK
jgi:hypothetical protein